jgi:hypothetical protein
MTSNETPYFPNEDDLDSLNVQFFELWSDKLKLCTVNTKVLDNLLPPDLRLAAPTNRWRDEDSLAPGGSEKKRKVSVSSLSVAQIAAAPTKASDRSTVASAAAAFPSERPEAHGEAGDTYEIGETDYIDTAFLDELRTVEYCNEDPFFPKGRLLVRECMRTIFALFAKADADEGQVVLIGSPGVGKSILFFFAALYKAQKETVVFLRRNPCSRSISAFVMRRSRHHDGSVDVLFARKIPSYKKLADLWEYFWKNLLQLKSREEVLCFIDGPKQQDVDGTLSGGYDFYCTSFGYDGFKTHQEYHKLWILDAWNDVDAVKALGLYPHKHSREKAEKVYNLCGGSIQRMFQACSDEGFKRVRDAINVDTLKATRQTVQALDFVGYTRHDLTLPDLLVAMFRSQGCDSDFRMKPVQYVDSPYVMKQLATNTVTKVFKDGYEVAIKFDDRTMQGLFYKRYLHHWLMEKVKTESGFCGITNVCWSEGSAKEGMEELNQPYIYWIPSIPNFYIDAAVLLGTTMHVMQYTVATKHEFNEAAFRTVFIRKLLLSLQFDAVKVHSVTAADPTSSDALGVSQASAATDHTSSKILNVVSPAASRNASDGEMLTVEYLDHYFKLDVDDYFKLDVDADDSDGCAALFRAMLVLDPANPHVVMSDK